jgi:CRP/FNR family cyclic AMP-dependent transcriptional regulator
LTAIAPGWPGRGTAGIAGRHKVLGRKSPDGYISLADADPDLLRGLDETSAEQVREVAQVGVLSLEPGQWEPSVESGRALYGLFVVEGLLCRDVLIEGRRAAELLGPGDMLRPLASEATDPSVSFEIAWEVLQPTTLAVLDRRFAAIVAPWPEVTAALMERMVRRAHALAFQLAVIHLKLVETRLLWYYAARWGRVTPEGRILSVRLPHALLARVVGARRPSVSTALGRLHDRGLVERIENGHWLLLGDPPSELEDLGDVTLPLAADPQVLHDARA